MTVIRSPLRPDGEPGLGAVVLQACAAAAPVVRVDGVLAAVRADDSVPARAGLRARRLRSDARCRQQHRCSADERHQEFPQGGTPFSGAVRDACNQDANRDYPLIKRAAANWKKTSWRGPMRKAAG